MRALICVCVLLLLHVAYTAAQSTLQINACVIASVDRCARTVSLTIPSMFQKGDTVAIHQISSSDSSLTGLFEVNIIDTIVGSSAHLENELLHAYDAHGILQLVRVLHLRHINDETRIVTLPWNGHYGGVVIIHSPDSLVVDGRISAGSAGFRGSYLRPNTRDTLTTRASVLGEGTLPTQCGRPRNGGGYGGSLLTRGGRGGWTTNAFEVDTAVAASEPRRLTDIDATAPRMYLGNAGGSGHQNDLRGGRGGNGGGAILISAPKIIMTSRAALDVSGGNGDVAELDGAGGGGSGGTIIIDAKSIVGEVECDVSGGDGGSSRGQLFTYGPGGGGAGGIVHVSQHSLLPHLRVQRDGGLSGVTRSDMSYGTVSYGARAGEDGVIRVQSVPLSGNTASRPIAVIHVRDTTIQNIAHLIFWVSTGNVQTWFVDSVAQTQAQTLVLERDSVQRVIHAMVDLGACTTILIHELPLQPRMRDEVRIRMDRIRGTPGDSVALFVRIERMSGRSALQGIAYIRLYQPVLIPVEVKHRRSTRYTTIGIPFYLSGDVDRTFRRIEAIAVLGDSAQLQLAIDSVVISPRSTTVIVEQGRFTLDGMCDDGRPRLFDYRSSLPVIAGRSIRALGDDGIATDIRGQRICQLVPTGEYGELSGVLPDEYRGLCYIVITQDGRVYRHVIMVGD